MKPQSSPKASARKPARKVERGAEGPALEHSRAVEGGHDGEHSLALPRRFARLAEEYAMLAREHVSASIESAEILGLALWGFDASDSAFVLVREGVIVLTNSRFHELHRPLDGSAAWNRLDDAADPDGAFADLEQLVLRRAAATTVDGSSGPVRFLRAGRDQVIEVRTERSRVRTGSHDATIVTINDVTERVRLEQEVSYARRVMSDQERVRLLGEVTSGVTHDLKNMLGALGLRLATARGDAGPVTLDARTMDVMRRIVSDGMATLTRLQDFARRGAMDPPIEQVDVCQAVRDALEMVDTEMRHSAVLTGGRGLTVETSLPTLPLVRGAAVELRQLFMNLLLNARDALNGSGVIRIGATLAGESVVVIVEDNGPGIAEPLLEKIFLPFFSTKGACGTGLGLFTAAAAMKRLGGTITARNRPEGGAQFHLTFPVSDLRASNVVVVAAGTTVPATVQPSLPAAEAEPPIGAPPPLNAPPPLEGPAPLDAPRRAPAQLPTQLHLSPDRHGPRTL